MVVWRQLHQIWAGPLLPCRSTIVPVFLCCLLALFIPETVSASRYRIKDQRDAQTAMLDQLRLQTISVQGEGLRIGPLLQAVGIKAGITIRVEPGINQTVSLDMNNVSLYQLLEMLLQEGGLQMEVIGNQLLISRAPLRVSEDGQELSLQFCPRYVAPADLLVKMGSGDRGKLQLEPQSEGFCLRIRGEHGAVEASLRQLQLLDQPPSAIEVVVLQVRSSSWRGMAFGEQLSRLASAFPETTVQAINQQHLDSVPGDELIVIRLTGKWGEELLQRVQAGDLPIMAREQLQLSPGELGSLTLFTPSAAAPERSEDPRALLLTVRERSKGEGWQFWLAASRQEAGGAKVIPRQLPGAHPFLVCQTGASVSSQDAPATDEEADCFFLLPKLLPQWHPQRWPAALRVQDKEDGRTIRLSPLAVKEKP